MDPQIAGNRFHNHMAGLWVDAHEDHRLRQDVVGIELLIVVRSQQQHGEGRSGRSGGRRHRPAADGRRRRDDNRLACLADTGHDNRKKVGDSPGCSGEQQAEQREHDEPPRMQTRGAAASWRRLSGHQVVCIMPYSAWEIDEEFLSMLKRPAESQRPGRFKSSELAAVQQTESASKPPRRYCTNQTGAPVKLSAQAPWARRAEEIPVATQSARTPEIGRFPTICFHWKGVEYTP